MPVEGALLLQGVLEKRRCSKMSSLVVSMKSYLRDVTHKIASLSKMREASAGKVVGSAMVRADE